MKLLIVEDDKDLCQMIAEQLKKDGYQVDCCYHGAEAMDYLKQFAYDCILLDRMLPGKDGLTILKELRKCEIETPTILVTAMDGVNDRIDGLDSGADDYLVKPFMMGELSARVRTLLRRPKRMNVEPVLSYSNLKLHYQSGVLDSETSSVTLSKKESALFEYFFLNHDQTLLREQIITRIWGSDTEIDNGNLDTYIYFLRRRLKAVDAKAILQTIHGCGYCFTKKE